MIKTTKETKFSKASEIEMTEEDILNECYQAGADGASWDSFVRSYDVFLSGSDAIVDVNGNPRGTQARALLDRCRRAFNNGRKLYDMSKQAEESR